MPQCVSSDHVIIEPSILYFGTPVVLITTSNLDGTPNISPMSSAWALADRVVLGLGSAGQGYQNLRREGECVLNFPSPALWPRVEKIARTTGRNPVPPDKARIGFTYVADKFSLADLSPIPSHSVGPPRIAECPLQLEAKLLAIHAASATECGSKPATHVIAETRVVRVHAEQRIVVPGTSYIDTGQWHPLLYVFRHYFGAGPNLGRNFRAET
jgi:flavin reductase (DIM6/NTAB) family NADH-FMN oxidoreductase RutF